MLFIRVWGERPGPPAAAVLGIYSQALPFQRALPFCNSVVLKVCTFFPRGPSISGSHFQLGYTVRTWSTDENNYFMLQKENVNYHCSKAKMPFRKDSINPDLFPSHLTFSLSKIHLSSQLIEESRSSTACSMD